MSATVPVTVARCIVCNAEFEPTRAGHNTCSGRCRVRKHRAAQAYTVTAEDRAAIRAVFAREGYGHPLELPPTPEAVRAHIIRTAERTDDGEDRP